MSYLCDLFFIFSLISIIMNHIISLAHLFFAHFLECLLLTITWIKKNNFQIAEV